MKLKISIIINIILLIGIAYLFMDNSTLLDYSKAADALIEKYEEQQKKMQNFGECIDAMSQYKVDTEYFIKAIDLKTCSDKAKNNE